MSVSVATARATPAVAWRDYVALTKPRVMSLLLLTAACGLIAGAHGLPAFGTTAGLLIGGALASGGASALNHVLDRDIDRLMGERTANRPVASGRLSPLRALMFGLTLSALAFALLAATTNLLAATLSLAGGAFYVLVYTCWLKRSTHQNIVIGGAAGALPPVVGYAAATGKVTLEALVLFTIVFVWTPSHFWALALLIKPGYEAAGVPMLPVVRGERETSRQILLYAAMLVAVTIAPVAWGGLGLPYLVAAVPLGVAYLELARRLFAETSRDAASQLFHYSLLYLALLFAAIAVDAAL